MTFWKKLEGGFKSIVSISLISAVISQLIVPAAITQAASPRFNFLPKDPELLRGANVTNNQNDWFENISGKAGDEFAGLVYYHNGEENTVANNTKIKVSLPLETVGKRALISASVSADNAEMVSDDMTLSLTDQDAKIEFVPGSVQWFPNQYEKPDVASPLPFGQTGNEIITSGGLNIGNIQGCWDFAGYVKFRFKTVKQETPAEIVKSKIAKNLTTGAEGTSIQASVGDSVLYTLTTSNTGGSASLVTVSDDISDILEYADVISSSANSVVQNGIISWPAANLDAGAIVTKTFTIKVKSPLPNNPVSGFHFDMKMFNLYGNSVTVEIKTPVANTPVLSINKTVRDFTSGETIFVDSNEIKAGDSLEYKIEFSNTGEKNADGVILSDTLPANVTYLPGTTILSMNDEMERTFIDGVTQSGLSINLPAKSHGYIKFKVATSASIAGGETLINTSYLKFADKTISDIASSKTKKAAAVATPVLPELPKTGAETLIIGAMLAVAAGLYFVYRERKKRLAQALAI